MDIRERLYLLVKYKGAEEMMTEPHFSPWIAKFDDVVSRMF
uniref:Uncharacterized protein n=1 Tax=Peronospora matthiolae TaxID=2874970 RepID=A0AAV1TYM1_9STRA